jgi:hypothetical protein
VDENPNTFAGWIDAENTLAKNAPERFGRYYENALGLSWLLANFPKRVDHSRELFVRWLAQARKHHALALLSIVRLHAVQGAMDLRQVLEAGAYAAHALANHDVDVAKLMDDDGFLKPTSGRAAYQWLDQNYPAGSSQLKSIKGMINETLSHANLVNTQNNFRYSGDGQSMEASFFDTEDDHLVKTRLWQAGNVAQGIIDLFWGVHLQHGGVEFRDDFEPRFRQLAEENASLRGEMMATERYRKAMRLKD